MTTLEVSVACRLDVTEVLAAADAPAAGEQEKRLVFSGYSSDFSLDADTTTVADGQAVDCSTTLAGSSEVFDLTAAPAARDINTTIDKTGQKLVAILLVAGASNNASGLTIGPDTSNGYNLWGNTSSIKLLPGEKLLKSFDGVASALPAVSGSAKGIKVAGTTGDVLQALLVFTG